MLDVLHSLRARLLGGNQYDPLQHEVYNIVYEPGRIIPVHCYGYWAKNTLLYGDEWEPGSGKTGKKSHAVLAQASSGGLKDKIMDLWQRWTA